MTKEIEIGFGIRLKKIKKPRLPGGELLNDYNIKNTMAAKKAKKYVADVKKVGRKGSIDKKAVKKFI